MYIFAQHRKNTPKFKKQEMNTCKTFKVNINNPF